MAKKTVTTGIAWHHRDAKDVLAAFGVERSGLRKEDVRTRQREHGMNEIAQKQQRSAWAILFSQFGNPMMIVLVFAAGVSLILGEWVDVLVIFGAVLINSVLGFVEEYKADRSLQELQAFLPQEVRVRREGVVITIESREIVTGDILLLSLGDKITADARLIDARSFEVSEAALTGESAAVEKRVRPVDEAVSASDQIDMAFAGTVVVGGRAEAVVVRTGVNTEIGRISQLVFDVHEEKTPLQRQLSRLAMSLGIVVAVFAVLIFAIGVVRGFDLREMFRISVALAVAAIPEGLVVAMTVILAIGMRRVLKRDALVRKLVASETLGSVSVICFDKTGTLTTGSMQVEEVFPQNKEVIQALWHTSFVEVAKDRDGNDRVIGTPTGVAIMQYLRKRKAVPDATCKRVAELPFDSSRKYAAANIACGSERTLFVLGAPEVLLARAALSKAHASTWEKHLAQRVQAGQRVLMIATRPGLKTDRDLTDQDVTKLKPMALIGLRDPLRDDAKESIQLARTAGLRPIMVTGDHPETALLIATEAGLKVGKKSLITGAELAELSDAAFQERVGDLSIYARVLPKQKVRIVRAWQEKGHAVAMTGDGVNDAPAMKAADIGVAFGSGTEVAKETADMVLLKNSFATIVSAIREGRIMFDNIRKVVVYLLVDSFSEVILVIGALAFSLPLPLLPAQILWINLITDGFPSIALTFEPGEKGIMNEPPRKKNEPILNAEMKVLILMVGSVTVVLLFAVYMYLLRKQVPIAEIRTFLFVVLGMDSLIYVFAVRTFRSSAFTSNPFRNPWLIVAVGGGILLQMLPLTLVPLRNLLGFVPLLPIEWLAVFGLAVLNFLLIEVVKAVFNARRAKN